MFANKAGAYASKIYSWPCLQT